MGVNYHLSLYPARYTDLTPAEFEEVVWATLDQNDPVEYAEGLLCIALHKSNIEDAQA